MVEKERESKREREKERESDRETVREREERARTRERKTERHLEGGEGNREEVEWTGSEGRERHGWRAARLRVARDRRVKKPEGRRIRRESQTLLQEEQPLWFSS